MLSSCVADVSWAPLASRPPEEREHRHLEGGRRTAATTHKAPTRETLKHNTTHHNATRTTPLTTHNNTQQHNTITTQPPTHLHSSTRRSAHHTACLLSLSPVVVCLLSLFLFCLSCLVSVLRASSLHVLLFICLCVCLSVSVCLSFSLACHRDLENFGVRERKCLVPLKMVNCA